MKTWIQWRKRERRCSRCWNRFLSSPWGRPWWCSLSLDSPWRIMAEQISARSTWRTPRLSGRTCDPNGDPSWSSPLKRANTTSQTMIGFVFRLCFLQKIYDLHGLLSAATSDVPKPNSHTLLDTFPSSISHWLTKLIFISVPFNSHI